MEKFNVGVTITIDFDTQSIEAEDIHDACAEVEHKTQQEFEAALGDNSYLQTLIAQGGAITVESYPE